MRRRLSQLLARRRAAATTVALAEPVRQELARRHAARHCRDRSRLRPRGEGGGRARLPG